MGPKTQKEPLMVEGVDINELQQPRLLRLVCSLVEKLVLERGERTRAQLEADLARTGLENSEKELEDAKQRRMQLHMQTEGLAGPSPDEERRLEEELQYVRYEVALSVQDREQRSTALVQRFESKVLDQEVPAMLDKKRNIQLEMHDRKDKLMEEIAVAGKHVVQAIDKQFAFSEELLLKRICCMLRSVSIRSKYLNIFYKVEMMKLQEEKNKLIAQLGENNDINFSKIRSFFKSIVQNDVVLIFSLQEKLEGIKKLTAKRLEFVRDVQERLPALKEQMKAAYHELKQGYNMAHIYEHNLQQLRRYGQLVEERKAQIEYLQKRKKQLVEEIQNEDEEKESYIEMMKVKKSHSQSLVANLINDGHIFNCYGEYFQKLADNIEEECNLERHRPGVLQELKKRLVKEHAVVKHIHNAITNEIKFTNEMVDEANRMFQQLGCQQKAQFAKSGHKKFPHQEGPTGILNFYR